MHDAGFLSQAAILFSTAVLMSLVFRVAKAPSIIGFLCTGMVIGPTSWGFIDQHAVEQFAEVGLVLLLFTIGLELSPAPLMRLGKYILIAMGTQVAAVFAVAAVTLLVFGNLSLTGTILLAIAISLSSTAIVLKQLSDKGEVQSSLGNITTGILLLQDVFVIGVMVLIPLFLGSGEDSTRGPAFALVAFVSLLVVIAVARKLLPLFITQLIRYGGQEFSALFAVMMAFGGAWLASLAGWPPALGACIAGLLLANADLRHQLVAEISPFRDVFNALFFISLGMLVNLDFVFDHVGLLLLAIVGTLILKTVITTAAIRVAGWPLRLGIQAGLGLCTVSEFGYILAKEANGAGALPDSTLEGITGYIVGTMIIGAILFPMGSKVAERLTRSMKKQGPSRTEPLTTEHDLEDHVIIVGFGVNGENLVHVLKSTHIKHCVIEMNQGFVKKIRDLGASVVVGDATREIILGHAGIERARAIVVAINDMEGTKRVVSQARRIRPDIYIAARTYFIKEYDVLMEYGANIVVPADFEASVKIFSHVLEEFDVPKNILGAQVSAVRAGGYGVMRGKSSSSPESMQDLLKVLQLTATQTYYVPENCIACDKTIAELDLRKKTGATIIAIVRDRVPNTNPEPQTKLVANDVLVMVGAHEQLQSAKKLLEAASHLGSAYSESDLEEE
jgi:CPA2 family monovalent cation:H+ antiporter-2